MFHKEKNLLVFKKWQNKEQVRVIPRKGISGSEVKTNHPQQPTPLYSNPIPLLPNIVMSTDELTSQVNSTSQVMMKHTKGGV